MKLRRRIPNRPMGAPPPDQVAAKDFFTYGIVLPLTVAVPLAAGATTTGTFNVDADSDFLWQKFTYFAQDAAGGAQTNATRELPGVTVTIKETSSGRDIMNTPIPLGALAGEGDLPFILPTVKLFPRSGTVSVTFSNITAATSYSYLGIFFVGTKLF